MRIAGMVLAVDFTAPALMALLAMVLPPPALAQMLGACILHEAAHFLAMVLLRRKPACLRVSAAGLRLTVQGDALCPPGTYSAILLAGGAANFLAGAFLLWAKKPDAAWAHISLGLFNLLPYRSTDGGTLVLMLLEQRFLTTAPEKPGRIMRGLCIAITAGLSVLLGAAGITSPSLWGMLLFMGIADVMAE